MNGESYWREFQFSFIPIFAKMNEDNPIFTHKGIVLHNIPPESYCEVIGDHCISDKSVGYLNRYPDVTLISAVIPDRLCHVRAEIEHKFYLHEAQL